MQMPRHYRAALPLRVGSVAATLLLAACGLTASGIAVTEILRTQPDRSGSTRRCVEASRGWALVTARGAPQVRSRGRPRPPAVELLRAQHRRWKGTPNGRQRQQRRTRPARPTATSDP